jgi:SPP1 gp7 family putative phage head morphogenesis protein
LTINEFRQSLGLEPTSWGDNWWIPSDLVAIENTNKGQKRQRSVPIPFGSPEHQRIDREFARQVGRHEPTLTFVIMRFFDIIAEEVKRRLRDNLQLAVEDPFDLMSAIPRLRDEITPPLLNAVLDILQQETASLNISRNVLRQRALEFISNRSQRFAQRVSETTWHRLRDSLRKGMELGEGIPKLEERVLAVIADRIRSTPETIARTEVVGALNGGKLLAWLENGDIAGKRWIATLDNRTRDSHREVHGLVVELLDNFIVGAGSGPAPGQIGLAEEDINCRCTIVPVFRWEMT